MKRRYLWLAISGTVILISVGALAVRGLNLGIDFKGGTQVTFKTPEPVSLARVRSEASSFAKEPVVQGRGALTGSDSYKNCQLLRRSLDQAQTSKLSDDIKTRFGNGKPISFTIQTVSSCFGRQIARAGFDFIRAAAPQSKIAVFGESLGTGPAVAVARDRPVAGVLLNAPSASVRRLFELRGLPIPYRWLMKDPFDSEALIGGVTAPLLILHGTDDPAIPVTEAHRLYDAAHEPKMIFIADGAGHLNAWEGGGERLALEALTRWTTPAELAR